MRLAILILISCTVLGCTSPGNVRDMTAARLSASNGDEEAYKKTLCIKRIDGGGFNESNEFVNKINFSQALRGSLSRNILIGPSSSCKYDLIVNILGIAPPSMMFGSAEVIANVNYSVLHKGTDDPFFLKTVTNTSVVTVGEVTWGNTRLRVAHERATKDNIMQFIRGFIQHSVSSGGQDS